jgi:hypothetical protein
MLTREISGLTAYFDDSGSHTNSDVVLWNGVFGNAFQWQRLNELWAATLRSPSPGKEPLGRFHMADCYHGQGEFLGWSRTAREFLVHELVDIILKCGIYSNGAAIVRKDWDDLVKGDLRSALGDAEGYSLRMAFVRASKWARDVACQREIAFIFDRRPDREREGKRIFDLFDQFARIESSAADPSLIRFSDSYRVHPLQAADLLAWQQHRYVAEYVRSDGKSVVASSSELRRLSKGGRVTIGIARRSAIQNMVALEVGNEEKIARAAELIIATPQEFAARFGGP